MVSFPKPTCRRHISGFLMSFPSLSSDADKSYKHGTELLHLFLLAELLSWNRVLEGHLCHYMASFLFAMYGVDEWRGLHAEETQVLLPFGAPNFWEWWFIQVGLDGRKTARGEHGEMCCIYQQHKATLRTLRSQSSSDALLQLKSKAFLYFIIPLALHRIDL